MSPRELPGRVIRGRIGVGTCLRSNSSPRPPNNILLTAGHYLIINTTFGSHIVCWRLFKVLDGRRRNGGIYNLGWAATRTDSQAPWPGPSVFPSGEPGARGVRPRLEGKPRTPLSSRVATRVSWSPLSGLKGPQPPDPNPAELRLPLGGG